MNRTYSDDCFFGCDAFSTTHNGFGRGGVPEPPPASTPDQSSAVDSVTNDGTPARPRKATVSV